VVGTDGSGRSTFQEKRPRSTATSPAEEPELAFGTLSDDEAAQQVALTREILERSGVYKSRFRARRSASRQDAGAAPRNRATAHPTVRRKAVDDPGEAIGIEA